jgi:hypothetical protein
LKDNSGNKVNVVQHASQYGYDIPGNLNSRGLNFGGQRVNFDLVNTFGDQGSRTAVFSNGGGLAIGVRDNAGNLRSVFGSGDYYATGTVNVRGRLGLLRVSQSQTQKFLTTDFAADATSIQNGASYLSEFNQQYSLLYNEYKEGGFTRAEADELNGLFRQSRFEYWKEVSGGDYRVSINSPKLAQFKCCFRNKF